MPSKHSRTPAMLESPLTTEQVCKLLGVSRTTLFRMKEDGSAPPYYNTGGRAWFEEAEVRAWFNALRVVPTASVDEIRAALARQASPRRTNPFRRTASK